MTKLPIDITKIDQKEYSVMRSSGLVLFVCAGLLLSGGAILGASTAWSLMRMSYYFWTSDLGAELGAGVLFVAGALLCLPACWLATLVPYHPRSLSLLATLMFLATASLLVLATGLSAMSSLSRALREPQLLNASMHRAMARDHVDSAVRSAFAAMQLELQCCGVSSYEDWYAHRRVLPASCCGRMLNGKVNELQRNECDTVGNVSGCLRPAMCELRKYVNSVSALAAVIVVILAVTLFAGAYSLVTGVLERSLNGAGAGGLERLERLKAPATFRLACLHPTTAIANAPPLLTITPPSAIPSTQQIM